MPSLFSLVKERGYLPYPQIGDKDDQAYYGQTL